MARVAGRRRRGRIERCAGPDLRRGFHNDPAHRPQGLCFGCHVDDLLGTDKVSARQHDRMRCAYLLREQGKVLGCDMPVACVGGHYPDTHAKARKSAETAHHPAGIGQAAALEDDPCVGWQPRQASLANQCIDRVRQIVGQAAADAAVAQGCHGNPILQREDGAVDIHFADIVDDDGDTAYVGAGEVRG